MLTVFAFVHKSGHRGVSLSSLPPSVYLAAAFVAVLVVVVVVCEACFPSPSRFKKKKKTPETEPQFGLRCDFGAIYERDSKNCVTMKQIDCTLTGFRRNFP